MTQDEIKELRRYLGLTHEKFAALLHVAPRTVKAWQAGTRRPRGLYLEALLEVKQRVPIFDSLSENKTCDSTASQGGTFLPEKQ